MPPSALIVLVAASTPRPAASTARHVNIPIIEAFIRSTGDISRGVETCLAYSEYDDWCRSFSINPGVGAIGIFAFFGAGAGVVGDLDFICGQHQAVGGSYDFGLKLGAGASKFESIFGDNHLGVIPVVSLIVGKHF